MFILACVLCGILFFNTLKLSLAITWGLAKVTAYILCAIALPVLIVCVVTVTSGLILILPVLLIATAWGLLRAVAKN